MRRVALLAAAGAALLVLPLAGLLQRAPWSTIGSELAAPEAREAEAGQHPGQGQPQDHGQGQRPGRAHQRQPQRLPGLGRGQLRADGRPRRPLEQPGKGQ
ncbi:MAG TPA: hypothetical protein VNT52_03510, partial [Acidimicrobiales bacterium]|nr:hypothetical protein [Acidimicrobiales bacterium]